MNTLFKNINKTNIEKLKRNLKATIIKYQKNVNILSNINKEDFIAIIDTGSVQLSYTDYNGNKIILEEMTQGNIFGSFTFAVKKEETTCITKEETQITYIEYNQITNENTIKNNSYITFTKNLIQILNEQINYKNNQIELLTQKTTRDKLLEYFKIQSQKKRNKTFIIPMTFTKLANYLSVDRSAMTREIGYLKEDGLIKTNGKKITLLY